MPEQTMSRAEEALRDVAAQLRILRDAHARYAESSEKARHKTEALQDAIWQVGLAADVEALRGSVVDSQRDLQPEDSTPQRSDSAQTPETFTWEALEALPLGTVILADLSYRDTTKTLPLERCGMGYGNPEKPGFRAFNGARYGRDWFDSMANVRILYAPQGEAS